MAVPCSENPRFSLKLLIDEKKNKVILAEAGNDFVELLSDLLTLPMGTVVGLLEKHQKPQSSILGCFTNLYRSVSIMDDDNFETQACKNLLLYPKSMKKVNSRRLNLNVDDDAAETKFFVCPKLLHRKSCRQAYSNFCTSICSCGNMMDRLIKFEGDESDFGNEMFGIFLSCRTSFIITDDMQVELNSIGLVLNVLNVHGYAGFDMLKELVIDVGFEEVLTLLGFFFASEAPLTETFLRKQCMPKNLELLTPPVQEMRDAGKDKHITLKVYVRKLDGVVLYAECREDFVDFLFSFLALPLQSAWELSIDNANMGCLGNLCRSMKGLSFEKQNKGTVYKCLLPHYYNFRGQLLDVVIQDKPEYYLSILNDDFGSTHTIFSKEWLKYLPDAARVNNVNPVSSDGFVKGETNFIVTDDLVVTPMKSSSTISLLSKLQICVDDIEEDVISIGKTEAASILRASLFTNSALTNGLSNLLSKTNPREATQSTKKIIKSEE